MYIYIGKLSKLSLEFNEERNNKRLKQYYISYNERVRIMTDPNSYNPHMLLQSIQSVSRKISANIQK